MSERGTACWRWEFWDEIWKFSSLWRGISPLTQRAAHSRLEWGWKSRTGSGRRGRRRCRNVAEDTGTPEIPGCFVHPARRRREMVTNPPCSQQNHLHRGEQRWDNKIQGCYTECTPSLMDRARKIRIYCTIRCRNERCRSSSLCLKPSFLTLRFINFIMNKITSISRRFVQRF